MVIDWDKIERRSKESENSDQGARMAIDSLSYVVEQLGKQLAESIRHTNGIAEKAFQANIDHVNYCTKRDLERAKVDGSIDKRLSVIETHKDYMVKAQKRNDIFNWAIVCGIGSAILLLIVEILAKHIV